MSTMTVRHPDGYSATIEGDTVVDWTGIPPQVIGRAEALAEQRYELHPGVEEPGYRLSFDDPVSAALTFAHAAGTTPLNGMSMPVTGWAGYDADGVRVELLPDEAYVGGPDADLEMPAG